MSTQLRLVEPPEPVAPRGRAAAAERQVRTARLRPTRIRSTNAGGRAVTAATGRRVVEWGEWRLDARTRKVGRDGVARARRVLADAADADRLSQAS